MEAGEFGELGRGQISDVGLPVREFKLYPESKMVGASKDLKFRELKLLIETFT